MRTDLQARLLDALAGTHPQQPLATEKLYPLGPSRAAVEAALQSLYEAREVSCCKITRGVPSPQPSPRGRGGKRKERNTMTRVVWWVAGQAARLPKYGQGVPGFPRGQRGAE